MFIGNEFYDVVFDVMGNLKVMECGLCFVVYVGIYVLILVVVVNILFFDLEFYKCEIMLFVSCNVIMEDFEIVFDVMCVGKILIVLNIYCMVLVDVFEYFKMLFDFVVGVVKVIVEC